MIVWPHEKVVGWNGREDEAPPMFDIVEPIDAFSTRHTTDAHAVGYSIPDAGMAPRLNKSALRALAAIGKEPVMEWAFVDVDNANHARWESPAAAAEAVSRLMSTPKGPLVSAGVYATRAGLRFVWRLATPIPCRLYKSWAQVDGGFLGWLSNTTGIPIADAKTGTGGIDASSDQWTRCFRLPYTVRDGVPLEPAAINLRPAFERALVWQPRRQLQAEQQSVVDVAAIEMPADAPPLEPVAESVWMALVGCKWYERARAGMPLATTGARDTTMMRAIGDVVAVFGTTDPTLPWQVLAPSVAADVGTGAPTLDKLWDRCKYVVSQHAGRVVAETKTKETPAFVFQGAQFWIYHEKYGTYLPPVKSIGLVQGLETYSIQGLVTRTPQGKLRDAAELAAAYAKPVRKVIAHMGRDKTVFDVDTGTLHESACPLLPVTPVFHKDVNAWLVELGGVHAEKLLDWVATVTRTDRPTCALYLDGPRGCGKGMLPAGLAALWGTGSTSYQDAAADFNGALAQCPIVHADEKVGKLESVDSATFRTLIGQSEHQLRRKFMESATLRGACRLIISANNAHAIRLTEQLTREDVDAIAERIFYIKVGPKASEYLRKLGGREYTSEWVNTEDNRPGKIAEHATWLAQNRNVRPGTRFLVEGAFEAFHQDMQISHGLTQGVLASLCHFLVRGQPHDGITIEDGDLLVNGQALRALWPSLAGAAAPFEATLGAALSALSRGAKRVRRGGLNMRVHVIAGSDVLRTADLLQIGDPEVLELRLRDGFKTAAAPATNRPQEQT